VVSLASVAATESYRPAPADFVPGWLTATDLPEIAAGLGDRPVTLAGTVDGAGRKMTPEEVRAAYAAGGRISVLPEAVWTEEVLARVAVG
jgi:hypothetical protein